MTIFLIISLITLVKAHEKHFPKHPEWDTIWPDPVALNDLNNPDTNTPPNLAGIWTGSPKRGLKHRYFFTPSGGGYGSSKDSSFINEPPAAPGFGYDVRCITGDWTAKAATPCGWDKARVIVSSTLTSAEKRSIHIQSAKLGSATSAPSWQATVTFYNTADNTTSIKKGSLTNNTIINIDLPWNHFVGPLTGLWHGPSTNNNDYYVMTHDLVSNQITAWWDPSESEQGSWYTGTGTFKPLTNEINLNTTGSWYKSGFTNPPLFNAIGNGTWGNYPNWQKHSNQKYPANIHTVHMIFMNHLDIGYTTTIMTVLNEYVHTYFQKVEQLGDSMRALEGTDRFIYTTHPWLMSLLMECPCPPPSDGSNPNATCAARSLNNSLAPSLTCAGVAEIQAFKNAVAKGDIAWHAAPMNNQFENQSPLLIEAGLKLTRQYDKQFYGPNKKFNETITMADRDVIYVTRGIIPFLSKYGVEGLTIGSNGANYPPQVPKLHVWKDESTGTDVIVVYHPYGYGGFTASTCDGPGKCGDCAEAPNGVALCTEFRTDNTGPPGSTDEIISSLDAVRAEYPKASVFASTFDNFIRDVLPVKDKLPVVTKEVGDTWMYGAPSDPLKMAQSRETQRVWEECVAREKGATGENSCDWETSAAIRNMSRWMMKTPEHTWGTPGVSGWGGGNTYNMSTFGQQLTTAPFVDASSSWAEQRIYNALAVAALEEANHPMAKEMRARYESIGKVAVPDLSTFHVLDGNQSIAGKYFNLQFDVVTGSLIHVQGVDSKTKWASKTSPLGDLTYKTFNDSDWKPFTYDYINGHSESGGFCKIGSNNYTISKHWHPVVQNIYGNDAETVIVHMKMPQDACTKYGGSFTEAYLNVTSISSTELLIELITIGKIPTMIGESTMLTFQPAPELLSSKAWTLDKIGTEIDPENVIDGGNQYNHGIWNGGAVATTATGATMRVISLDAPNMCPQTPNFPHGNPLSAGSDGLLQLETGSVFGMGVNLHNNLWNTNYPLYYPYYDAAYCTTPYDCENGKSKFRFKLELKD